MLRIGQAIDIHPLKEGRDLILGGVKIDHEKDWTGIRTRMFSSTRWRKACSARSPLGIWERIFRTPIRNTVAYPA